MNVLITGGTGFIGSVLVKSLAKQGYDLTVLTRNPQTAQKALGLTVKLINNLGELNPEDCYQVIINLAGAPIFDDRWSNARKQIIRDSRIALTERLVAAIGTMAVKPDVLISGSAIGYYGDQDDTELTEESASTPDFSQQLCSDWENAALEASQYGVRVCLIRTGLVIAEKGGLLQRMLLPFRLGLGGSLGDGRQWMSWIHRQDWLAIAERMIIDASMHGAYNATSPNPVTNKEFTNILAARLARPALLPMPAWLLNTLLGERAGLLLGSQRVLPKRLLNEGFNFRYATLASALDQALADG